MVSVNRGFALLIVLWVVAILSALSLAMISSTRVEARTSAADWDRLNGERLARSGQEVEQLLRFRNLIGPPNAGLAGLPVDVEVSGFRYRLHFPEGDVDLYLESDTGKINPATADSQFLRNFATIWKGDNAAGQQLADAIQDWCDPDSEIRPNGAELGFYSSLGYAPRNYLLGVADLPLIRGFGIDDFYPKLTTTSSGINVQKSLDEFVTTIPTGGQINPNFAPRLVLLAVPGLTAVEVEKILEARREGFFFRDLEALQSTAAIPAESAAVKYFRLGQSIAPASLTVVRMNSGKAIYSERRVSEAVPTYNPSTGIYEYLTRLYRVEVNRLPNFLTP